MKYCTTIAFLFLINISLVKAQGTEVGVMTTFEGEQITLYKRGSKKMNLSRMEKGCDCQLGKGNVLLYVSKDGEINKIKQSQIKNLKLNKGTSYCKEASSSMTGGGMMNYDLGMKLPESLELFGLPIKKNGKLISLHSVLFEGDKHILTLHSRSTMESNVYIFTKEKHQFITGGYNYLEVGYGKEGKKALQEIKNNFRACKEFINAINETVSRNSKVKRLQMVPVLQNAYSQTCN